MTEFLARKGEKVTREDGAVICTVARDILRTDIISVHAFEDWQIDPPVPHTPLPADPPGQRWLKPRYPDQLWNSSTMLHLERGWV